MSSELVRVEPQPDGTVRIIPCGSLEDISLLPAVLAAFETEFRKRVHHFVLDLGALAALPPGWVALIFELTARSRRRGGELCVVNLQRRAQGDLLNFQPEHYLCLEGLDEIIGQPAAADSAGVSRQASAAPGSPDGLESRYRMDPGVERERPESHLAAPGAAATAAAPGSGMPAAPEEAIEIPSRVDALYRVCDFVLAIASRAGFGESDLSRIKISVYEGSLNVIEHAYHSDPTRQVRVTVRFTHDRMVIEIIDWGDGFNVRSEESFDATAAAAARRTGGMGLHIIRRSMDLVHYVRDARQGNRLILEKLLPAPAAPSSDAPGAEFPGGAAALELDEFWETPWPR